MTRGSRRRTGTALLTAVILSASLILLAAPALGTEGGQGSGGENCPSPTTLLVSFSWDGTSFVPDGGNGMGVAVSGDADLAYWSSAEIISALVLSAGDARYNVALDFPETVGSVSPHNYAVFGGAALDAIAFCTGEKTKPDTTTHGPSIELTKTAECATVGDDGMATVTGTITAELHPRVSARITTALDTLLGPGGAILNRASVGGLVGHVLTPADVEVTIGYEIVFDPGDATAFENFIEVTIEDADTGEDRQKIYNARAAFELCESGEAELGSITIIKDANPDGAQDFGFSMTGTDPATFSLDNDADATLSSQVTFTDLAAGAYSVSEAAVEGWGLTSITCSEGGTGDLATRTATVALVAGANVTCTFLNTREGSGTLPGTSPNPTPREGTQGGNPLPNTSMLPDLGQSLPVAPLALLALITLGAVGTASAARIHRRR